MKSAWDDMSGLAGLGLSGSLLKTLKSAGSALEEAQRVNSAILGARVGKAGAGLPGVLGGMHDRLRLDDRIRIDDRILADDRVRPDSGFLGAAARIADANPALGKHAGLGPLGGIKGIAGRRFEDAARIGKFSHPSAAQDLEFGKASRAYPALDALLGQAKGASPLYSLGKASELAGAIPRKRAALGFPETTLGAGADLSAARASASFLRAGIRADYLGYGAWKAARKDGFPSVLSGWPKDLLSGASTGLPEMLGSAAMLKRVGAGRDVMDISGAGRLFGSPRGLDLFGIAGSGLLRDASPALGAFEAVRRASGSGLEGLIDAIGRFDLEALREAERVREVRRPRTRIGLAALDAYDELYMGHPWVADRFLLDHLGIRPNDDRREALWRVLREAFERTLPYPARWMVLDDKRAAVYLRVAVYNEVDRIEADRERPNRVWWTAKDPETEERVELRPTLQPDEILELMMKRSGNPADIVAPPLDERGWILEMLYLEGSEQDRRMVEMVIAGHDLAAIAGVVGWPEVQRFQRKAQRWRRIRLDRPPGG